MISCEENIYFPAVGVAVRTSIHNECGVLKNLCYL